MKKRNLLIAGAVLAGVGGLFAAVRFTPLFDGYLDRGANAEPPSFEAMARRFHRGDGVCLRYLEGSSADDPAVTQMAERLWKAGISAREFGAAVMLALEWSREREAAAHALAEADEWYLVLTERLSPSAKLLLRIKGGDALREKLEQMTGVAIEERIAEGRAAFEQLSADEQRALKDAWTERPETFAISNALVGLETLRRHETEARLDALATAARADFAAHGVLPERIEHITGATQEGLLDAWDQPLSYERIWGGVKLTSFGRDGSPDGDGPDADVVREVIVEEDGDAPGAPTGSAGEQP